MYRRALGVLVGSQLALCLSAAAAEAQVNQSIVVSKWQGLSVSTAQIDQSFALASQKIAKTCAARLSRSGSVRTFAQPASGSMATRADWDLLYYTYGYLKVVKTITWCGETGSFAGCTGLGGPSMMMEQVLFTEQSRVGHILAHEFGHSLGYEDDHVDLTNIMAWDFKATDSRLTAAQCARYRTPVELPEGPRETYLPPGQRPPPPPPRTHIEELPIEQLARSALLTRVPMDAAARYGRNDALKLRALLVEPREALHHVTALRLLGVISDGDENDALALIDAAHTHASASHTSAALIGLGYLANRGNRHALDYLAAQLASDDPEVAGWAIQALGVSGRPEAALLLRDLERDDALVAQALADNAEVARVGLDGYYAR